MKNYRFLSKKTIIGGSVIFIAFLFILMAFAPALSGAGQTATPATQTGTNYFEEPTMNTNITWSTFNHNWTEEEYNNGTGNATIGAGLSTFYKNAISVNPTDIIAPGTLQNEKTGSIYWNNTTEWGWAGGDTATNQSRSISEITSNGITEIQLTDVITGDVSGNPYAVLYIPITDYASQTPKYDYITTVSELTAPKNSASSMSIYFANQTGASTGINSALPSQPLAIEHTLTGIGTQFNTTAGKGYSNGFYLQEALELPNPTTTGTYTITIYAFSMTDYKMSYGTNSTGTVITNSTGNLELSTFSPSFKYTSIVNNGYTIAVSQKMQNITESQSAINDGSFIEQATQQGTLKLPSAPDLSYSTANISMPILINTSQIQVLTLNGVSYLNNLPVEHNGTFYFGTVNPNDPNSMIIEQKFTASEWDSSTHAPSFFSLRGIEYYWWVGVIGGLSIIGLGAAAVSHFGGEEEDLKIPKGKFGR